MYLAFGPTRPSFGKRLRIFRLEKKNCRTEGGAIMLKSFYFFLVSNSERGVAFSAEGFLYVISKLLRFHVRWLQPSFSLHQYFLLFVCSMKNIKNGKEARVEKKEGTPRKVVRGLLSRAHSARFSSISSLASLPFLSFLIKQTFCSSISIGSFARQFIAHFDMEFDIHSFLHTG